MERVDFQTMVIQDLINLEKRKEIDISPWYQRRSIWKNTQKSYLINTLLEQKPIPAIYIRHSIDIDSGKSTREIVDGQQRTRAILEFYNDKFSSNHPEHKKKVLYSQLNRQQQQRFLLTQLSIGYLLGATDADVIDIFGRINSVSKSLNDQEKRNASYSGEMKQFCLKKSVELLDFWRDYEIFNASEISRMREITFISDIAYNLINGLSDYSAQGLTKFYEEYDENFNEYDQTSTRIDSIFSIFKQLGPKYIKDTIFQRQPLLFSLAIVVDSISNIDIQELKRTILDVDAIFNDESNPSKDRTDFIAASTSTTQRIAQRKVRDKFIREILG